MVGVEGLFVAQHAKHGTACFTGLLASQGNFMLIFCTVELAGVPPSLIARVNC